MCKRSHFFSSRIAANTLRMTARPLLSNRDIEIRHVASSRFHSRPTPLDRERRYVASGRRQCQYAGLGVFRNWGIVESIGYSESSTLSPTGRARRVAVFVLLLVEPYVLVVLLLAAVAATFALIGSLSYSRALEASVVPLVLSVTCWLLNVRLERRARAQERRLLELFVALGGDPAGAFPQRAQTARERVDAKAPLPQLTAQDLLGMVREAPCRATRATLAWVALVCVLASVAPWVWYVVLYAGAGSTAAGPVIVACLLLFAVAWSDLRHGRARSLRHPRQARLWGAGRHPQRPPLVLPSLPMMSIMFVPAGLLGANWAAGT